MSQSRQQQIDYFHAITNWEDTQRVIEFLDAYAWNLDFAVDGYLTFNNTQNNELIAPASLYRMNSRGRESLFDLPDETNEHSMQQLSFQAIHTNGHHHEPNQSAMQSTHHLHSSSDQQQTASNSNQTVETATTTSFHDQIDQLSSVFPDINRINNKKQLLQYIDANVIGKDLIIKTPWNTRKLIYADYVASGRGLAFLEHYMLTYVLPYYANTHSENNTCALQTTKFREGSRKLIKKCVNATDDDCVIFTGSGSTAAINKLVNVLQLKDEKIRIGTVVLYSTFEHHSNILPWKETGVEMFRIPNTRQGLLDEAVLIQKLEYYQNEVKKNIICTFNAASNVTGIRTDVDKISTLVHQYNGLIFWDYAAAAPYVKIDMNPSKTAYKDAIFISTHKFVGGPGTPGLLIAKKKLFTNPVPHDCGGGTVVYVTRENTEYVKDIESREEGGTPNILGSIRSGLVFHLKQSVGDDTIEAREDELVEKFFRRFKNNQTLLILGSSTLPRLAIFAFLISVPSTKKYLHHNFVCSLLNDLFGIQVRSGCSCAGPYVLDLLDIGDEQAKIYTKFITDNENGRFDDENNLIERNALMKPGFIRFNLSYFASDEEVDYILDALDFITTDGYKFLPLYTYDVQTAVWRPRVKPSEDHSTQFYSLQMINYDNGTMGGNGGQQRQLEHQTHNSNVPQLTMSSSSNDPLDQVRSMAMNIPRYVYENIDFRTDTPLNIPDQYKDYVWFATPKEIILKMVTDIERQEENNRIPVPFRPRSHDE